MQAHSETLPTKDRRPWQWLTLLSGLIFVTTFGLEVDSFRFAASASPLTFSPLSLTIAVLEKQKFLYASAGLHPLRLAGLGLVILPHLLATLLTLYSGAWLAGMQRAAKTVHMLGVVLGGGYGLFIVGMFALQIPTNVTRASGGDMLFAILAAAVMVLVICGIPLLVAVHGLLAMHRRSWTYIYHGFAGSAVVLWLASRDVLGMHGPSELLGGVGVSFAAACVLFIARVGEARAITRLSWPRTLGYLLILRLSKPPAGTCPRCGYCLYGLPDMRCPECGGPFTDNELGIQASAQVRVVP